MAYVLIVIAPDIIQVFICTPGILILLFHLPKLGIINLYGRGSVFLKLSILLAIAILTISLLCVFSFVGFRLLKLKSGGFCFFGRPGLRFFGVKILFWLSFDGDSIDQSIALTTLLANVKAGKGLYFSLGFGFIGFSN